MTNLEVGIRYDNPLGKEEARTRGIDPQLSRLVLRGEIATLADAVFRCGPKDHEIFIHSCGEFTSIKKLDLTFKNSHIDVIENLDLVRVDTREQAAIVFAHWSAEHLVIFFSDRETAIAIIEDLPRFDKKWWQWSSDGYETPYLKQLNRADPIIFYSESRSSLEILGSEDAVLKCLCRCRPKDFEDCKTS
jgi:hypothetical protein